MRQERLEWRSLPATLIEPPYNGDDVLIRTASGAIQAWATVRPRLLWNYFDLEVAVDRKSVTHWCPLPDSPTGPTGNYEELQVGQTALIYDQRHLFWIEARYIRRDVSASTDFAWLQHDQALLETADVEYWQEIPTAPGFQAIPAWRKGLITQETPPWSG